MRKLCCILILFLNIIACGDGGGGGGDENGYGYGYANEHINENHEENNVPLVTYSTEYGTCLSDHNSESFLNYSDIGGKNITLIWNCADYENPYLEQFYSSHIELLFSEYQDPDYGPCYQFNTSYISEGICDAKATIPQELLYSAEIVDVYIGTKSGEEIPFSLSMKNTGNVTLLNIRTTVIFEGIFYADFGEYPYTERTLMQGADFHVGVNNYYNLPERGMLGDDIGDATYDVTIILSIGDGQVLDVYYLTYYPY